MARRALVAGARALAARTRALAAAALLLAGAALPAAGAADAAGTSVSLRASFRPARAGARTTMSFGFQIHAPEGLPPALTHLTVDLPRGLGIDMAGVGVCRAAALEGGRGCSADAQVGQGSVTVAVPLGEQVRDERAKLTVYRGPDLPAGTGGARGDQSLLFDAVGRVPIATRIVFSAAIAPGAGGASIQASIPLEPTLPNSPDAAITSLASTLGTLGRAYHGSLRDNALPVNPRGITLPRRCPGGGLPLKAVFAFDDGSRDSAGARAGCRG